MSSPTFERTALASMLLLAACQRAEEGATSEGARRETQPVRCIVGEGGAAGSDCRMEVVEDAQSRVLILSLPSGSFRRLRVAADGSLSAADGAVEARTVRLGPFVGVAFGSERYAVPTSALGGSAPQ